MTHSKHHKRQDLVLGESAKLDGDPRALGEMLTKGMSSARELAGLVSKDDVAPPLEQAEPTYSPELMERVALALFEENSQADHEDRLPSVTTALNNAGVSLTVYLEMASHPDFQDLLKRTTINLGVLTRWDSVIRTQVRLAEGGDVAAARFVQSIVNEGRQDAGEALEAIRRQGGDALRLHAANAVEELSALLAASTEADAPEDVVSDAVEALQEIDENREPEAQVDLAAWQQHKSTEP